MSKRGYLYGWGREGLRSVPADILDELVADDWTWWTYSQRRDCDWALLRNHLWCVKPRGGADLEITKPPDLKTT